MPSRRPSPTRSVASGPEGKGGLLLLAALASLPGLAATSPDLAGQQVADTAYAPPVPDREYPPGRGPVVLIDEAHGNFHTADARYAPFARLLARDGYVVRPNREPFSRTSLQGADVLVVANALAPEDAGRWRLPISPAFTPSEVSAVEEWVRSGGALLLVADHMPFPAAARNLAAAFGLRFQNGFAMDTASERGRIIFRRSDGTLAAHPVTDGRGPAERVDSVTSFTGQAFRLDPPPERAVPGRESAPPVRLLVVPEAFELLLPEVAWEFSARTPRIPAAHLLQGTLFRHGLGRVAAFGEAAMLTAQLSGPEGAPMGMNAPGAEQNHRLVLNLLHWLTGRLGG